MSVAMNGRMKKRRPRDGSQRQRKSQRFVKREGQIAQNPDGAGSENGKSRQQCSQGDTRTGAEEQVWLVVAQVAPKLDV
jgi:ribosome assembly protein YihI (activator of Der GTPase)